MRFIILLCCLFFSVAAQAEPPRKLQVVASFSIIGDFAKQIGGDRVEVTSLVGPNTDIHSYEPKPADAKLLRHADLFIVNGLGLEGFIDRLTEASGFKGDVVIATQTIVPIKNTDKEEIEEHGAFDPHAWQSLENIKIYARNIATAYAAKDPEHAAYYDDRLKGYIMRIDEMEAWASDEMSEIPEQNRVILLPHESFAYFARDYNLKILSLQSLSTESEPSAQNMAAIVDAARKQSVHALFFENIGSNALVYSLAQEAHLKVGGALFSDALSDTKGVAGSYLEMFGSNVRTLTHSLH